SSSALPDQSLTPGWCARFLPPSRLSTRSRSPSSPGCSVGRAAARSGPPPRRAPDSSFTGRWAEWPEAPPDAGNLRQMAGTFKGWKGDFKGFFLGLRANNNKAFFEAHRRQYEDEVKAPMLALLADLEPEFGLPHRVSRPNRDIRFSADKSPYKLNIYAEVERGGYLALDAEGLVAAGGRYMGDDVQLKRLREAIAADRSGQ